MFRLLFTTLILALGVAATAHASDEPVVIVQEQKGVVVEDSSEYWRMTKKFSIYAEVGSGSVVEGGLGAAYFLDRNSQILLDYASNSIGLGAAIGDALSGDNEQLSGFSLGLNYKRFLGNSFFVRGGLDYRQVNYSESTSGGIFSLPTSSTSSFSGNAIDAVVAIGNDWQWQNFTLGFDWIRVMVPISTQVTATNWSADNANSASSAESLYLTNTNVMTAFHLGTSF